MSHVQDNSARRDLAERFLALSTASFGKPEYTKKTKKACVFCHVDSKAKARRNLTEAGKYYQGAQQLLDGYKEKK